MPRLGPRLLRHAYSVDPLLRLLLPVTRDLQSAQNELRWLREHAAKQSRAGHENGRTGTELPLISNLDTQRQLVKYCHQRSRGTPLQYILGTEYFGHLEVKCEPGVLIPRWETASLVEHLATRLHKLSDSKAQKKPLRILEPCTGTGCMSLLLHHALAQLHYPAAVHTLGLDISPRAVRLARHNLSLHPPIGSGTVDFRLADLLSSRRSVLDTKFSVSPWRDVLENYSLKTRSTRAYSDGFWDVLMSNPPYVSPRQYRTATARSVRLHEPEIALVPPEIKGTMADEERGDLFYPALLDVAVETRAKCVLFEVGDMEQAGRVVRMVKDKMGPVWRDLEVEVWRDEPGRDKDGDESIGSMRRGVVDALVKGRGNVRGVFAWDK